MKIYVVLENDRGYGVFADVAFVDEEQAKEYVVTNSNTYYVETDLKDFKENLPK